MFSRGDLEEALRIRTEEQLPVYERLGDVREFAACKYHIAGMLFYRGESNAALRILCDEALPILERLDDAAGIAACKELIDHIRKTQENH